MFKLIIFVVGIALGFGSGMYVAADNPELAKKVAAAERQKIQEKLDKLEKLVSSSASGMPVTSTPANSNSSFGTLKTPLTPSLDPDRIQQIRDIIADLKK